MADTPLDTRFETAKPRLIEAANAAGVDVSIMVKIAGFESSFNYAARPVARDETRNTVTQFDGVKAISSAYGYGQFLNGTWQDMLNKYGEKYGVENAGELSKAEANTPELRNNLGLQAAMLAEFTKENIQKGARLGGADADANVYAFHNLGDGDATKFLNAMKANPGQRADEVLSATIISGNPSLYGDGSRTLADSYKAMRQKMDAYEKYALEATQDPSRTRNPATAAAPVIAAVPAEAPKREQTANWPAPGNFKINDADKAGEGHGEFGTPRSNRSGRHSGLDIEGKVGDRIEPFAAGKVVFAGQATGYGNTVVIDHGNGQRTLYAHLNTINVQNGQEVTPDTKIATMGRSGNTPSAGDTHLHFEIRTGARAGEPFSGTAVDPLPYLKNTKSIDAPTAANALADGTLRQGERGPEVKRLQEQLNALHIKDANGNALIPDSDFGKHTKEAVRAFQAAHHLVDDGIIGKDTLAALKKAETVLVTTSPASAARSDQSPLLSNPSHPDNGLYKQALAGMEKLPANTFKSELERQNAAAAVTFEAKVSGMTKIDTVALSTNGSGLFAVQGAMNDPGHNRIYVDKTQAAAQSVEKSTQQLQQEASSMILPTQTQESQKKAAVM